MKEKILVGLVVGFLEAAFFTACATAGGLFARCIELKMWENLRKKEQEKAKGTN